MLIVEVGTVGGWRAYGGGGDCCGVGEVVVSERSGWWRRRKDDGKRFGRRWIRAESIGFFLW